MTRLRAARLGAAELGCDRGRAGRAGPTARPGRRGPGRPARARPAAPAAAAPGTFGVRILGVSEVTRAIRGAVRADPRLADLWVEGEIGRVTVSSAGHAYFALKDERNQLQCVWFRDDRLRSAFEAQAGLRVVAHGRIDLFEPQGALQLYVESIQPAGLGDLTLRFEALKARLAAEGLFDAARKRPLPVRPATIAVITSPTGAVWKDICHVLGRRWPLARVVLVAAQVQGEAAPASLVGAFRKVERYAAERQRGGPARRGARGHDPGPRRRLARGPVGVQRRGRRAGRRGPRGARSSAGSATRPTSRWPTSPPTSGRPTPSAAAEIVVPDRAEFLVAVRDAGRRLDGAATARLRTTAREVVAERRALDRLSPAAQLASARERVGLLLDRATRALGTDARRAPATGGRARQAPGPDAARPARTRRGRLERSGVLDSLAVRRTAAARASLGSAAAALAVLGAAGDARSRLRDRPPRRRRRDRARSGRGPGRHAPGASGRTRRAAGDGRRALMPRRRMADLTAVVVFVVGVAVVAGVGIWLGMLLAPRITRLTEPNEEEHGGDDD